MPVTITETIQEVSGSISQYRYLQVLLTLEDAGNYKGDDSVHQKGALRGRAPRQSLVI
ncbi:hypothetical protein ACFS07_10430 [Undibacterium arcticum]